MKGKRRLFTNKGRLGDRRHLAQVPSPDDLEIGVMLKPQTQGNRNQLINEESPDDLEINNEQERN